MIGERQDAQVQTGRPPLGAANELVDDTVRHLVRLTGNGQRIDAGVGQVVLVELENPAAQPTARQTQGGKRPTRHRQCGSFRDVRRQGVEGVEGVRSIDQVHVVEHQQEGPVARIEDRSERGKHLTDDPRLPTLEQILDMARVDAPRGEGTGQMTQEHDRVVVTGDQGQPPRRAWIGVHPLAGERGLAVARTRANRDQRSVRVQQPLDQRAALQHARTSARRSQALGDDTPGVDHDPLRHALCHRAAPRPQWAPECMQAHVSRPNDGVWDPERILAMTARCSSCQSSAWPWTPTVHSGHPHRVMTPSDGHPHDWPATEGRRSHVRGPRSDRLRPARVQR